MVKVTAHTSGEDVEVDIGKARVWATGIFLTKDPSTGDPSVYTLSVLIPKIMSGEAIQKKLMRGQNKRGQPKVELIKVLLTKDEYSPMEWWAFGPATLNKKGDTLWGDGEGRYASWWD